MSDFRLSYGASARQDARRDSCGAQSLDQDTRAGPFPKWETQGGKFSSSPSRQSSLSPCPLQDTLPPTKAVYTRKLHYENVEVGHPQITALTFRFNRLRRVGQIKDGAETVPPNAKNLPHLQLWTG